MTKKLTINYASLPVMAICLTRSTQFIGRAIQLFRGGIKALTDKLFPNHALLVTQDHGQKFATEEMASGLVENSLEEYTKPGNKITEAYHWVGFNDEAKKEAAEYYLAEIRRRAMENSKYDWKGLFSFVPFFKLFTKPDPAKQWCSENVASILKKFGCTLFEKTEITPDQLLKICKDNPTEFVPVINFYKE